MVAEVNINRGLFASRLALRVRRKLVEPTNEAASPRFATRKPTRLSCSFGQAYPTGAPVVGDVVTSVESEEKMMLNNEDGE